LEQPKNLLYVFSSNDLRLMGAFRTGNRPSWMSFSADKRFLIIANSAGENLTVINLDTMQPKGLQFLPQGHNPISVAADNADVLVAARVPGGGGTGGVLDWIEVVSTDAFELGRLGIYENAINPNAAMVPMGDLSGVFIAEADGNVKLWDATLQKVVIARKDLGGLQGSIAAGTTAVAAGGSLLNRSLVPVATFVDTPNTAAGFVFVGNKGVRTSAPTGLVVDTGAIQRVNLNQPDQAVSPVRMAESPAVPGLTYPFLRTLAALRNGSFVSTTSSGVVQLDGTFDAGIAIPQITAITSAADFSDQVGSGGLISIFGRNLAPQTASAGTLPLPTALGDVCVTANGLRLPLLYVSPTQINAQLPFEMGGQTATLVHSPGGLGNTFYAEVKEAAPAVFRVNLGNAGSFPAVVRAENNLLATLANPVRPNETILVYATAMGPVGPPVDAGMPGPVSPLATSVDPPSITLGGVAAPLYFAGLAPGFVGVYQLNVKVPGDAPEGVQVPLTISVGDSSTTVNLRVVR
ncbi:MAG: hypothetical protein HY236_02845, partial [Acidobacteria bacterium]|nr:hypothetical protein [Acidobacteriota bacterium]